jgi:hypothetical protein
VAPLNVVQQIFSFFTTTFKLLKTIFFSLSLSFVNNNKRTFTALICQSVELGGAGVDVEKLFSLPLCHRLCGKNKLGRFSSTSFFRPVQYMCVTQTVSTVVESLGCNHNTSFSLLLTYGPNKLDCCNTFCIKDMSGTKYLAYWTHSLVTKTIYSCECHPWGNIQIKYIFFASY